MQLDNQLLSLGDDIINYNSVKELVLRTLTENDIIDNTQAQEYAEKWQIIVIKKSWFKRWSEKFAKNSLDYVIKYVKFEN